MSHRPYPSPDRALHQLGRHDDETPPLAPPLPDPTGVAPDPGAWTAEEALASWTTNVMVREAERTEEALREHLATHTTEQFVRVIHDLRVEVAQLRGAGPVRPDEEQT